HPSAPQSCTAPTGDATGRVADDAAMPCDGSQARDGRDEAEAQADRHPKASQSQSAAKAEAEPALKDGRASPYRNEDTIREILRRTAKGERAVLQPVVQDGDRCSRT